MSCQLSTACDEQHPALGLGRLCRAGVLGVGPVLQSPDFDFGHYKRGCRCLLCGWAPFLFSYVGSGQFENATPLDYKALVKIVLLSLGAEDRMSPVLVPPVAPPGLRTQLWLIRGIVLQGEGQDSGQERKVSLGQGGEGWRRGLYGGGRSWSIFSQL